MELEIPAKQMSFFPVSVRNDGRVEFCLNVQPLEAAVNLIQFQFQTVLHYIVP